MSDSDTVDQSPYFLYSLSLPVEIIFTAGFLLTTLLHSYQLIRYRSWYFLPFVVGGYFEVIGLAARWVLATQNPNWEFAPYVIQTLLTLLGPSLFAASIYMILSRIVRLTCGQHLALVPEKWVTTLFVSGDVISFVLQCAGGIVLVDAHTQDSEDLGRDLVLAGLGIQVAFFTFFLAVSVAFHHRIHRSPTTTSIRLGLAWKRYFTILYISGILILIRSVFRLVEFSMGDYGPMMKNEVYYIVLDATLMFLCMLLYNYFHPSQVFLAKKIHPGSDFFFDLKPDNFENAQNLKDVNIA